MTSRNLMITMLLGGLRHGAAWNFVLWGFCHGLILVLHRLAQPGARAHRPAIRVDAGRVADDPHRVDVPDDLLRLVAVPRHFAGADRRDDDALQSPQGGFDWAPLGEVMKLVAPLPLVQWVQWRTGDLYFTRQLWSGRLRGAPLRVTGYAVSGPICACSWAASRVLRLFPLLIPLRSRGDPLMMTTLLKASPVRLDRHTRCWRC